MIMFICVTRNVITILQNALVLLIASFCVVFFDNTDENNHDNEHNAALKKDTDDIMTAMTLAITRNANDKYTNDKNTNVWYHLVIRNPYRKQFIVKNNIELHFHFP